jgi:hypothetical protein
MLLKIYLKEVKALIKRQINYLISYAKLINIKLAKLLDKSGAAIKPSSYF